MWQFTRMRLLKMTNGGVSLRDIDEFSVEEVNAIFGYWQGEAAAQEELKAFYS